MTFEDFKKLSKEEQKKVPFNQLPTKSKVSIFILIAVVVIIVAICIRSFSSKTVESLSDETVKMNAEYKAEVAIKLKLKAPSTAEFVSEGKSYYAEERDSTITVSGSVDAQNSFGAMLRNHYTVKFKWTGDSKNLLVLDSYLD